MRTILPLLAVSVLSLFVLCEAGTRGKPSAFDEAQATINEQRKKVDATDPKKKYRIVAESDDANRIVKNQYPRERGAFSAIKQKGKYAQGVHKDRKSGTARLGAQNYTDAGLGAKVDGKKGSENAIMRNSKKGDKKEARLSANRKRLDTKTSDDDQKHESYSEDGYATNDVKSFNKNRGTATGTFKHENKRSRKKGSQELDWSYEKKSDDASSTSLKDKDGGRFGFNRKCDAEDPGESGCYDPNNSRRSNVQVISDRAGNTQVKKNGVVVTSAKCEPNPGSPRLADGSAKFQTCVIAKDVLTASVDDYKDYDCMSEYRMNPDKKVEVETPLNFNYDSEKDGNGETYTFPSCFDMSSNIEFKGFSSSEMAEMGTRLGIHYISKILPLGKLQCRDKGSCSDNEDACYYCDWCRPAKKKKLGSTWENFDGSNLCDISNAKQRIKATVCPPPEWNSPECTEFKQDSGMFDAFKQGKKARADLHVEQRFFLAPPDVAGLRGQCARDVKNPLKKTRLQLEFLTSDYVKQLQKSLQGGFTPNRNNDGQLKKYCLAKKYEEFAKQEEARMGIRNADYDRYKGLLIGCKKAIVNYNIGGTNKKANNALLKTVEQTGAVKKYFKPTKCPKVDAADRVEDQEIDRQDEAWMRENPESGGGGILGGVLGGGSSGGSGGSPWGNFGNFGNFGGKKK